MTATVTEFMESRSLSTSGGRGSARRLFHVSGVSNPADLYAVIGTLGLPRKFERHPDFPGLVARDFNASLVSGHTDLWRFEWTYEQTSAGSPEIATDPTIEIGPPEVLPNEVTYVEESAEIRAEFVTAYRRGPGISYPTEGTPTTDEDEVAGVPIDKAGVPISVQRNIQEFTITETVNEPDLDRYRDFRFCRNSSIFRGFGIGTVLYRGASVRRTGVDVYQVAHSFVEDSDFHLQQSPLVDQDGKPFIENGHARDVYWVQPFMTTKNLNQLSSNF